MWWMQHPYTVLDKYMLMGALLDSPCMADIMAAFSVCKSAWACGMQHVHVYNTRHMFFFAVDLFSMPPGTGQLQCLANG